MSVKRVLVTGASGFVGSHFLEDTYERSDIEVFGTTYGDDNRVDDYLDEKHRIQLNLLDREATLDAVAAVNPHYVLHLAALSSPAKSFDQAAETYQGNITAQLNLLDALRHAQVVEKIIIAGSADEYGLVDKDQNPINESCPLRPLSPYAVTKITQDYMGLQYFLTYKLPVVRLRLFNHTGERQADNFVIPAFAKQIVAIEQAGGSGEMAVGDLTPMRDFMYVKDVIEAYLLAFEHCEPGEVYNVGSGVSTSIQDLLNKLLALSDAHVRVNADSARYRPVDVPMMQADAAKFRELTGWSPTTSIETMLDHVLNYWRSIS